MSTTVTVFETRYISSLVSKLVDVAIVLPLEEALERHWPTDAHFVPYDAGGVRLTKKDLGNKKVAETIRMNLLVWDMDGPPHPTDPEITHWWTPEWWEGQQALLSQVGDWIENIAWYITKGGYRVILVPPRPLRLAEWRTLYKLRTEQLQAAGIVPDPQCTDWTRFYRLPRVCRERRQVTESPEHWGWEWEGQASDFAAPPVKLEAGERNGFLASLAGSYIREGAKPEVWGQWLEEANLELLEQPLDDEEVSRVAASISNYAETPEGSVANGGDVELAQLLVDSLGEVLSDRDTVFAYKPGEGYWHAHPEIELKKNLVETWEGAPIQGTTKTIRFNDRRLKDIVDMVKVRTHQHGFFDDAPVGVVAFNDGMVWDHGTYRAADGEDRLQWHLDISSEMAQQGAPATRWQAFLDEMVADAASQLTLQEFFGATLTRIAVRYSKALFMKGEGSNGKSVVCSVLKGLLPRQVVCSISPHKLEAPYFLAEVAGASLNVVEELPRNELVHSEAFKAVISGSTVEAARKYGHPFTFMSQAACLFAGNNMPAVSDFSWGFWRRILMVDFPVIISAARADTRLVDKILAADKGALVAWSLKGAERLLAQGHYTEGEVSKRLVKEWRHSTDSVSEWLSNRGLQQFHSKAGQMVSAITLLADYRSWAVMQGLRPLALKGFQERLVRLGLKSELVKGQVSVMLPAVTH